MQVGVGIEIDGDTAFRMKGGLFLQREGGVLAHVRVPFLKNRELGRVLGKRDKKGRRRISEKRAPHKKDG